jgi:hypothetical protein
MRYTKPAIYCFFENIYPMNLLKKSNNFHVRLLWESCPLCDSYLLQHEKLARLENMA